MRVGLLFILVGILYLMKNMGFVDLIQFSILWPVILILIGISLALRRCRECGGYGCRGDCVKDGPDLSWWGRKCSCDCETCKSCEARN